jgi:hypothetical protein
MHALVVAYNARRFHGADKLTLLVDGAPRSINMQQIASTSTATEHYQRRALC